MRIALDARAAEQEVTGIGNYITRLAEGLNGLDYDVTLLYSREPKIPIPRIKKVILPAKSRFSWEQTVLPRYLSDENYDIYHATWNYGIPWNYNGKSVLTVHDIIPLAWPNYFLGKNITGLPLYLVSVIISILRSRKILVDSTATSRDLKRILRVSTEKISVVALGIRTPEILEGVEQTKIKYRLDRPYLIYFGGIDKRKNIDGLIRAYALSSSRESHDLAVVGKFSDYYIGTAKKAGVGDKVKFIGYVSEVDKFALIKGATALVYPSFYEGFGFPVLEAMSVGTPVITSNTSSLPEAVGNAAITINPRNIKELATAIDKATSDKNLQESLRQAGYNQVKKFNWDETVEKTLAVYKEVLSLD